MVIDFQHHYIPVELAKKRGLYSETGKTMLQEGGLPCDHHASAALRLGLTT